MADIADKYEDNEEGTVEFEGKVQPRFKLISPADGSSL